MPKNNDADKMMPMTTRFSKATSALRLFSPGETDQSLIARLPELWSRKASLFSHAMESRNSPGTIRRPSFFLPPILFLILLAVGSGLSGCGGGTGELEYVPWHFDGSVLSDEPQATLAGQKILNKNGTAADAAVTVALSLSVTRPTAAGLGGGGICLIYSQALGTLDALDFRLTSPQQPPAVVPALAALQTRFGRLRWEEVVVPAEVLAGLTGRVSRTLTEDLRQVDPDSLSLPVRQRFLAPDGSLPKPGTVLPQRELAEFLGRIRKRGPGLFFQPNYGLPLADAWAAAGAEIPRDNWKPRPALWRPLSAFIERTPENTGPTPMIQPAPPSDATPAPRGAEAAATGFVVVDSQGLSISCVLSMGHPLGTGTLVPGIGVLLGAPDAHPGVAGILTGPQQWGPYALFTATGPKDAETGAQAMRLLSDRDARRSASVLASLTPKTAKAQAGIGGATRLNALWCREAMLRRVQDCHGFTDPRGHGLMVGFDR